MSDALLREIRDLIQVDVNRRGLATDPEANLINACRDDFAAACRSIAETPHPALCVVTGFYIADADPPAGETDGPLGALFLARALTSLGIRVALATDPFGRAALEAGVEAAGLCTAVPILPFSAKASPFLLFTRLKHQGFSPTHLLALERVGPSHAIWSIHRQSLSADSNQRFQEEVPSSLQGRCFSMRGRDITSTMTPAHELFDEDPRFRSQSLVTIGIGDGGNEIGMGKIPWDVIRRNVPNGGLIACRVPTDYLIVAGVSNWGAYALAAGVALLRGAKLDPSLFDLERERELLRIMVERGPLVDGVTGKPTVTVDGLPFDEYVKPLRRIKDLLGW
jgi:D-glutamate cyclase